MNRLQLHNVLCPMNLSSPYVNALEGAQAIARARSAELTAFHVAITEGLVAPESPDLEERADIMKKLQGALVASDSANIQTRAVIRQGDPGTQILEFARSLPAVVVVMGAAGAQRPTRPMGSVTAAVIARCDCPVLIVPTAQRIDRPTSGVFKQILCAVGLAPSSVGVIKQALSPAWETHGHVMCVCVMTEPSPSPSEIRAQLLAAIPSEAHSWCDLEVVVKPGVPRCQCTTLSGCSGDQAVSQLPSMQYVPFSSAA